eukprot:6180711-Pleurochrysis_carterae.AAC.1
MASPATNKTLRGGLPARLAVTISVYHRLNPTAPYSSTSAPGDGGRVFKFAALALATTSCAVREELRAATRR